jgi:Pyridoxamine 5'-phosphate oxidase
MTSLPDSARAVLESAALAHLVTLNPDGSPQVTIVGYITHITVDRISGVGPW